MRADAVIGPRRDALGEPVEGGVMQHVAVIARLRPGAAEQAKRLIELGPPFDPRRHDIERHTVFLAPDTVVFVFQGGNVNSLLAALGGADEQAVLGAWEPLLDGTPLIAQRPTTGSAPPGCQPAAGASSGTAPGHRSGRQRLPVLLDVRLDVGDDRPRSQGEEMGEAALEREPVGDRHGVRRHVGEPVASRRRPRRAARTGSRRRCRSPVRRAAARGPSRPGSR